jgi:hypothetical protein
MLSTEGYRLTIDNNIILIAFLLLQLLHENALMLRYTILTVLLLLPTFMKYWDFDSRSSIRKSM